MGNVLLVLALSAVGVVFPPLLLVLGLLALVAAATTRHRALVALGVVWLLSGVAINFGLGTSTSVGGHSNSQAQAKP